MTKSTAVAKREKTALGTPQDFGEDAGVNAESTQDELILPFISVLQSNSPEVEDNLVKGAKSGMFINSVSKELFDGEEGVVIVPAYREHVYTEWVPRDEGGGGGQGFRGKIEYDSAEAKEFRAVHKKETGDDFGIIKLDNRGRDGKESTQLIETYTIYGVLLSPDCSEILGPCAVSFASTKIKRYRDWKSTQGTYLHPTPDGGKVAPPFWAHLLRITSGKEKNKKGTFFNVVLQPALEGPIPGSKEKGISMAASIMAPGDSRYEAGKSIARAVESGAATVDYSGSEDEPDEEM